MGEKFLSYYNSLDEQIKNYLEILGDIPSFIIPYMESRALYRLRGVSYFCGMEYGSSKIYSFNVPYSRLDHSLAVAIMTYHFTQDKVLTIKALLHDIATPCFSHVIDYMQGDFTRQVKTEEGLREIILQSDIADLLVDDGISIEEIVLGSREDIVDNHTPKLCTDRLDGFFMNSWLWSKAISLNDIKAIYKKVMVLQNELGQDELGVADRETASVINLLSVNIGNLMMSKEDMFSMLLLADLIKYLISHEYFTMDDLYLKSEAEIMFLIREYSKDDLELSVMYQAFSGLQEVTRVKDIKVKKRYIDPLVGQKRVTEVDPLSKRMTDTYLAR